MDTLDPGEYLEEGEIWPIGDEVGIERGKATIARANLARLSVTAIGLSVEMRMASGETRAKANCA
jgi:hypothetical protein